MTCGDKYRHLAVTESGLTLEQPYGIMATSSDYEEWFDLAQRLSASANDNLNWLGTIECEATGGHGCDTDSSVGGSYPEWNRLVPLNNSMTEKYQALVEPLPWWSVTPPVYPWKDSIDDAKKVVQDALCLMELVDEAASRYKSEPPAAPGSTGDPTKFELKAEKMPRWLKWMLVGGGFVVAVSAATAVAVVIRRSPKKVTENPKKVKGKRKSKKNPKKKKTREAFDPTGHGYVVHPDGSTRRQTKTIKIEKGVDYGTDPAGDGIHVRMVPSGDIVTVEEARRRLGR